MKQIIGFDSQLEALIHSFNLNQLHNSIILHGPKGIGKRTFINYLITKFFQISLNNHDNFNHHLNLFKNNTHPNIKILSREIDPKNNKIKKNISIDQIRKLKKFIYDTSFTDNLMKIVIIDSADDLNLSSANSFLKTLEEPNENTFIFLITHQLSSLLPTVRSRCLKVKFDSHNFSNFSNILSKLIKEIDSDEMKFLFELTIGSPGIAHHIYDDNILDIFDLTLKCLISDEMNNDNIELTNILSKFDNEKFKNYLFILKTILILLNKIKINNYDSNRYLSNNFNKIKLISSQISIKNIINRLNFITNNEKDLFTYNLDKKIFMLRFLTN